MTTETSCSEYPSPLMMRPESWLPIALLAGLMWLSGGAMAAANSTSPQEPSAAGVDQIIPLWSGEVPGLEATLLANESVDEDFKFKGVSHPELWVSLPKNPGKGRAAIVICPGGGYGSVGLGKVFRNTVNMFNDWNVVAFGLKYRINRGGNDYFAEAKADAQRAIRLVRAHAEEWGIDPERVGIMGISAGGNVCVNLLGSFDNGDPTAADPVDRASSRPDFVALFSPWAANRPPSAYSILSNPPPTFIAVAEDDHVAAPEFARAIGKKLNDQGGKVEFFSVPTGGHTAFDLGVSIGPGSKWPESMETMFP